VISGFRIDVVEICALLGYYAAWNGDSIPTFQDILSISSSSIKKPKKKGPLKVGPIGFPEPSVRN
jgi:hypothetical protein